MNLAALLTCHNRKEKTIASIEKLLHCPRTMGLNVDIYLVDDGSSDDTASTALHLFKNINLIRGDGNLYWNGGMRVAFDAALTKHYDYYLWLNDDTLLYPTALQQLLDVCDQKTKLHEKPVIVVGATQDESTKLISYGGVVRPNKWKPTTFKLLPANDHPVECEAMNGNCVLIPAQIANALGSLEPAFAHAMGDLDYGLRARAAGFSIWVAPGFVGTCSNNSPIGSFNDTSLPVSVRLRKMLQPKGVPLKSWRVFTQRHAGVLWPLYWLWPYAKVILSGFIRK